MAACASAGTNLAIGYIVFEEEGGTLTGRGPIAKFVPAEAQAAIAAKARPWRRWRLAPPPARTWRSARGR
jgi:hypothetical protein